MIARISMIGCQKVWTHYVLFDPKNMNTSGFCSFDAKKYGRTMFSTMQKNVNTSCFLLI